MTLPDDSPLVLRDHVESALRGWNRFEIERGAPPVIDFDCTLDPGEPVAATGHTATLEALTELHAEATTSGDDALAARIDAHVAYLEALLGRHEAFGPYVLRTQGCAANGWSTGYVRARHDAIAQRLAAAGIAWDESTAQRLADREGRLGLEDARAAIMDAAARYEPAVRALTGSQAQYALTVELVTVQEYWSYWVDGAGSDVRLRINLGNATFTQVTARQFALHEVLGHGLQCASFTAVAADPAAPVDWVRLMSVHAPQQVLLEGLAEALPRFIAPDDHDLGLRAQLAHYLQLVMAQLHVALNNDVPISECIALARSAVPFWDDERIAGLLADRGANALYRSYMWAYPAGSDWFHRLADHGDDELTGRVFRAAYAAPLTPAQLQALWPDGPVIGGSPAGAAMDEIGQFARG